MPLLSVQNLNITKTTPDRWLHYQAAPEKLIDQISFDVKENQCLAIVGEKNSGKKALSMAILRMHPVSSGQIFYKGENLLSMSQGHFKKYSREIQIIFPATFSALPPHHSVAQVLNATLNAHFPKLSPAEKDQRIEQSLQLVDLPMKTRESWPDELNPSQTVRVALARALLVEPRLLICHDSVATLERPIQAEILNLILDLREALKLTLLFITHDLAIAEHMSDHMLILHRGSIVESGKPEDIVDHPKHNYTKKLVASTSTM